MRLVGGSTSLPRDIYSCGSLLRSTRGDLLASLEQLCTRVETSTLELLAPVVPVGSGLETGPHLLDTKRNWHTPSQGTNPVEMHLLLRHRGIWPPTEIDLELCSESGGKKVHFQWTEELIDSSKYGWIQMPVCLVYHRSGFGVCNLALLEGAGL